MATAERKKPTVVTPSERIRRFQTAYAGLSNEERRLLPRAIEQSAILAMDTGGKKTKVTVGGKESKADRDKAQRDERRRTEEALGVTRGLKR
jgi:hypothetical protein